MYLIILNLDNENLYATTHFRYGLKTKDVIENRNTIKKLKKYKEINNYQFAFHYKKNIVFKGIHPYGGVDIASDINPSKKYDPEKLINYVKKLSNVMSDEEIDLLTSNKLKFDKGYDFRDMLIQKFYNNIYEIRLIGSFKAGLSTIMYMWFGITFHILHNVEHIPENKTFNDQPISFRTFDKSFIFKGQINSLKYDSHIIYVEDSTKKDRFHFHNNPFLKRIYEFKNDKRILIIANKQDLPDAMNPEEIEQITGQKTVGFSASAPDAPERLEQIISDFLSD